MGKQIIIIVILASLSLFSSAKKEILLFDLKFSFAKGGEAVLIITDTVFNETPAIKYTMVGRTTGITDKLFGVNDAYETIVDANTLLPLKSIRNIKENKYRSYNETLYYHDVDSIYSLKSGWRAVPHELVDIMSVFFYFIHYHLYNDIGQGHTITLPTFHADKISDVSIKFAGETKIETDMGKINTYILAPVVDKGKLLNRSDGLKFYISKENKVPVLIEFDMKLGILKAVLRSYKINDVEQITS